MATIERAGLPAVGIFGKGFAPLAEMLADQYGLPRRRLAVYPAVLATEAADVLRRRVATDLYPQVVSGLLPAGNHQRSESGPLRRPEEAATPRGNDGSAGRAGTAPIEHRTPGPAIVLSGDFDEIQEQFIRRGWSDGLPVVPPTPQRVARFLDSSPLPDGEVLGVLAAEQREASVHSIAVNGVMAGCRPEYMPLLVAIVSCLADPVFRIEDAGSTPGWEPLVLLSGPLAAELGFNSGTGAMRVGRQANTSVGRFVRLYLRNVAGYRIPPGTTDQAGFGMSFLVAMAEDDEAVTAIGWSPQRVERGFAPGDSVVTVQGVVSLGPPIYSSGDTPGDHLRILALAFERSVPPFVAGSCIRRRAGHHILALSPAIAAVLAGNGLSKADLQRHLYDEVRMEAGLVEYIAHNGPGVLDLADLAARGAIPEEYATSSDPGRRVRVLTDPSAVTVVVAGNPDRNQSRAYIGNHVQGMPVSRRIER